MSEDVDQFVDAVRKACEGKAFVSLVLSSPVQGGGDVPRRQSVRPVLIRGEEKLQWELQFSRQQTHLNLGLDESLDRVRDLFGRQYRNAHLFTPEQDLVAHSSLAGVKIKSHPPTRKSKEQVLSHNKQKEYLIPEGVPCPFLVALDVMSPSGQVKPARQKKFRQINRYLEIVNDIYPQLPATGVLKVVDFGCGLSYLTFALHYLLTTIHKREVELLGIDQNDHVISRCQGIAADLKLAGLQFESRKIDAARPAEHVDLAVSLHACDVATDHALAFAVSANATVILAVPCCQHELSTQLDTPSLNEFLKHGVLKERFAAMATDALRSSALEAAGYRTQVMEFIDLEHTPKNILLRAVRRPSSTSGAAGVSISELARYNALKEFLGGSVLACDTILAAASNRAGSTT